MARGQQCDGRFRKKVNAVQRAVPRDRSRGVARRGGSRPPRFRAHVGHGGLHKGAAQWEDARMACALQILYKLEEFMHGVTDDDVDDILWQAAADLERGKNSFYVVPVVDPQVLPARDLRRDAEGFVAARTRCGRCRRGW